MDCYVEVQIVKVFYIDKSIKINYKTYILTAKIVLTPSNPLPPFMQLDL
jgi:hypothetical protein